MGSNKIEHSLVVGWLSRILGLCNTLLVMGGSRGGSEGKNPSIVYYLTHDRGL
jgi:hypothetical protein